MKLLHGGVLCGALFFAFTVQGEVLTNFFTGTVNLAAGDISDFFYPGTTNPLPGVCVMADLNTAPQGAPGSIPERIEGLNESPGAAGSTKDMFIHPSGFNQRRIMSAYSPDLHGGTVYVAIDLPGGTGSRINEQFFNHHYGAIRVQDQPRPFDADGNGQADGLGFDPSGRIIPYCPAALNDLDVWSCLDQSSGATDNPRVNSVGFDVAIREFYTVAIAFGDFTSVALDFEVTFQSAPGQADLRLIQREGTSFGVMVSSDTGITGVPQGYDVIFALTNVNANVDPRSRLIQYVGVDSGSNRDGSGQGEDFNLLQCVYVPFQSLTITAVCPPEVTLPGGFLSLTGEVCNLGQLPLSDVRVTSELPGIGTNLILGPITLGPGECRPYNYTQVVPTSLTNCFVSGTVNATAPGVSGGPLLSRADVACPLAQGQPSLLAEIFCPDNPTVPGQAVVVTGWICNDGDVPLADIVVTNQAFGIITNMVAGPFNLAPGECVGYSGTYVVPLDFPECFVRNTIIASAIAPCGGLTISGTDTRDCQLITQGNTNCPARCAEPYPYWLANRDRWPLPYTPSQTIGSVFAKAPKGPGARTLLEALQENTGGPFPGREFMREATAALLNAASPGFTYPFSVEDVMTLANAAFKNGSSRLVTGTTAFFREANEATVCPPCLGVTVTVACLLPRDECGPFGTSATGYRGLTDPAFGYSITVTNCGPTTISNITVLDSVWGDLTADFFPEPGQTLDPRKSVTKFYKMAWATTTTNVISVRGLSLGPDAGILTDEETVFAEVVDVTPTCLIQLISSADADGNPTDNRVQLPFTGKEHRVKVQVVVCNNSPVALKGVTIDPGELKCKKAGPFKLAPGQCLTNELCMRKVDCPDMPLTNLFTVTATLDVPNGLCASDVDGKRIAVRTQCDATIECLPEGPPGLTLTKTADTTTTSPGGKVIYDYTVRNTGQAVLTNVQVSDDNGTPEYSGDDLVVGTIGLLAPGESVTLSRDLYLPMRLCSEETGEQTGLLVAQTLATDNILVTFLQSLTVSDNTYGANAIGWGAAGGRSFQDLWHSDYAEFQFRNGGGDVVLQFRYDYLSPTAKEPSGYGTLGVSGGDGGIVVGNANRVIFVATSLSHQLNTVPFINQLPIYTVNSPALNDPLSRSWEYRTIYTAVIDRRAFGPSEFGSVSLIEAHNSPAKIPAFSITTCGGCVTNIAYVVGSFRDGSITNSADTVVCTTNRPFASCPLLPSYWAENSDRWLRYVSEQTVETVFIESGRHSNAPRRSLLQAIRGEAGLRPVRNLLEQAVAALLNAEAMGPGFPYSRRALVDTVNNALIDGSAATLAALTELLSAANDDENCAP